MTTRWISLLLAGALALAACTGGETTDTDAAADDTAAANDTGTADGTAATADGADGETVADADDADEPADGTATTAAPEDTEDDATTSTTEGVTTSSSETTAPPIDQQFIFEGDRDSEYCRLAREAQAVTEAFEADGAPTVPASLQAYVEEMVILSDQGISSAPPEISTEFGIVANVTNQMAFVLEQNDWDFFAVLEEVDAITSDPEVIAAEEIVGAYGEQVCGLVPDAAN